MRVSAAGLTSPVSIARDSAGIPTIVAADRRDLAFGTGFAHAQDRFFQMDLIRRRAAGELSEIVGAATIEADKRSRFHRFRDRARAVVDRVSDEDLAILRSYANGVNAGLESLGSRPFEYLVLGVDPEPWHVEDTVLVVYAMFMQLNDERASKDVRRGLAARAYAGRGVYQLDVSAGHELGRSPDGRNRGRSSGRRRPAVFSIRDVSRQASPRGRDGQAVPGRQQ